MSLVAIDYTKAFQVKFTNYVKLCFVAVLQAAFADTTTPDEYRYSSEISSADQPKLGIWRVFPRRVKQQTNITVEVTDGNANIEYLGAQENEEEVRDLITNVVTAIRFSGPLNFTVQLTVSARSTTDRERIVDILTIYTRHLFRPRLASLGLGYTRISIGGENQSENSDGEVVYTNSVVIPVYTEYQQDFPVELVENINNVQVDLPVLFGPGS